MYKQLTRAKSVEDWKKAFLTKCVSEQKWTEKKFAKKKKLHGHSAPVTSIVYDPSTFRAISASKDQTIKLWELGKPEALANIDKTAVTASDFSRVTLTGHTGTVSDIKCAFDLNRLISCSFDKTVRLWDLQVAKATSVLKGNTERILCLAYDPQSDPNKFVTGSRDGSLLVKLFLL
jgi:WD40 repeat protein